MNSSTMIICNKKIKNQLPTVSSVYTYMCLILHHLDSKRSDTKSRLYCIYRHYNYNN